MILIRHGQTIFNEIYNATKRDPGVVDPELTPLGRRQAETLAESLAHADVTRLVSSPYTRALQTASIIADTLGLAITVDARVGERRAFVCDIGTPRSVLARRWPAIAFGHLDEEWWSEAEEAHDDFATRCLDFAGAASRLGDWRSVAVVCHWGVIRALTGQPVTNGEHLRFVPSEGTGSGAGGCAPARSVLASPGARGEPGETSE